MSTLLVHLKSDLERARTPEAQHKAAIAILQYCLPNPSATQYPYWTAHDQHISRFLREFILNEEREGILRNLITLNQRLQQFANTYPPQAGSMLQKQLHYLHGFMASRSSELAEQRCDCISVASSSLTQ